MAITVEHHPTHATIRLDRAARANAYDDAHLSMLDEALDALDAAPPGVVVIEAAGDGAFCAGADLGQLKQATPLSALDLRSQRLFHRIATAPFVSIAAVHGPAVAGGCELALACDLRVVGPRARFSLPETELGLIPSAGGTTRLTRLLGPALARQVILAGRIIDAEEAVRWGLALSLHDDPRQAAADLAARVARRDPVANRLAKEIIAGDDGRSLWAERVAEALLYSRRDG
ncbi:MAG: enoyl-CoA hydratase/isomerase family protein [Deltaproteobacteria bacterium]|nr:MAG: enoyl-CoA hydratase/isomerase family protein [Deltaproteobacteria bacterium]